MRCDERAVAQAECVAAFEDGPSRGIQVQHTSRPGEQKGGSGAGIGHCLGSSLAMLRDPKDMTDVERFLHVGQEQVEKTIAVLRHRSLVECPSDGNDFKAANIDRER